MEVRSFLAGPFLHTYMPFVIYLLLGLFVFFTLWFYPAVHAAQSTKFVGIEKWSRFVVVLLGSWPAWAFLALLYRGKNFWP